MQGPPKPHQFWAKLHPDYPEKKNWHPLLAHSADVAAVTEALLQRTILRDRLASLADWNDLSDVHVARLSALAAIHDAGKVNHGFQNRAFDRTPQADHVQPIVDVLNHDDPRVCLDALGVMEMLNWFERDVDRWASMLLATWGHHGRPVSKEKVKPTSHLWTEDNGQNPIEGLERLGECVRDWFSNAFTEADPFPDSPHLQHAFNGVLTLADWISSDVESFLDFAEEDEEPMEHAEKLVDNAIDSLFLDADISRNSLDEEVGFDRILENEAWEPYPIQEAVRELPLYENGSLTVLESDTGSGKTEAALARFMRLYQRGLVGGMYFAVPTRTAAKQLYERVDTAAKEVFPVKEKRPPVVQAVPGYIKADDVEATRMSGYEVHWDEDILHRGWAAEHPKRYLAGSIVVGTIDQVLLSTLQVDHAHLRASSLLRHFLVVDEVHASDTYMKTLMEDVLDRHLRAGGHAFLMSATLGAKARTDLTDKASVRPPALEEAASQEYPLVTHVDASRTEPEHTHADSSGIEKIIEPDLQSCADDPETIARKALDAAQDGARVLVIRNRVEDCLATQRALEHIADDAGHLFGTGEGKSKTCAPHHSRFAPDDRRLLDQEIEDVFGKESERDGIVVVATQTVEQSLDIDSDLMITDLCPMDVLLQRIGRLHRHPKSRNRPEEFETARCLVLTPNERDLTDAIMDDGKGWNGPHGLGTVYDDLRVIEATWQVLEDEEFDTWEIPKHNRVLVERATHPDRLEEIVEHGGDAWSEHERWVIGEGIADREMAGYVEVDWEQPFGSEAFPTKELKAVKTRLGREDYRVLLPEEMPSPFASSESDEQILLNELSVTEDKLDDKAPETEEADQVTPFDGGFTFQFCDHTFSYDRFGLALDSDD